MTNPLFGIWKSKPDYTWAFTDKTHRVFPDGSVMFSGTLSECTGNRNYTADYAYFTHNKKLYIDYSCGTDDDCVDDMYFVELSAPGECLLRANDGDDGGHLVRLVKIL